MSSGSTRRRLPVLEKEGVGGRNVSKGENSGWKGRKEGTTTTNLDGVNRSRVVRPHLESLLRVVAQVLVLGLDLHEELVVGLVLLVRAVAMAEDIVVDLRRNEER